ncbi:PEP-CTERM sorting domain-containing protein [Floridanema aerugineum]|jgi:hypothetical protein|uniref:PEP-CTERM sorting domain-containing protein n=1 Tax=Floridaenema aerugineum BLCC-F46 TaxID=3153654 RepID=A0ABV4X6E0_9CYAN
MSIRKNLLIATATLTLLGTATVTPAQAFILRFESTDGQMTGNIVNQNDWPPNLSNTGLSNLSITGKGWSLSGSLILLPGMQVGNQWSFRSVGGMGQVHLEMANDYRYPIVPSILINNVPREISSYSSILLATSTKYPTISLLCDAISDCLGDYGTITLSMSMFDRGTGRWYSWDTYTGEIKVTAWNPTGTSIPITPGPTNSVPEPSSASALLLLGTGWLLRRKLAVG